MTQDGELQMTIASIRSGGPTTLPLVAETEPAIAETLRDPQAQDIHTTSAVAAMSGNVEPLPAAQTSLAAPHTSRDTSAPAAMPASSESLSAMSSSLESFVPGGGLHSIAEPHAKRSASMFLRRVWRDGAICDRSPADH